MFRAKDLHAGTGALSRGAQRKLQLIELMAERANVLLVESKGGMRAEADKLGLAGLAAEVDAW